MIKKVTFRQALRRIWDTMTTKYDRYNFFPRLLVWLTAPISFLLLAEVHMVRWNREVGRLTRGRHLYADPHLEYHEALEDWVGRTIRWRPHICGGVFLDGRLADYQNVYMQHHTGTVIEVHDSGAVVVENPEPYCDYNIEPRRDDKRYFVTPKYIEHYE